MPALGLLSRHQSMCYINKEQRCFTIIFAMEWSERSACHPFIQMQPTNSAETTAEHASGSHQPHTLEPTNSGEIGLTHPKMTPWRTYKRALCFSQDQYLHSQAFMCRRISLGSQVASAHPSTDVMNKIRREPKEKSAPEEQKRRCRDNCPWSERLLNLVITKPRYVHD